MFDSVQVERLVRWCVLVCEGVLRWLRRANFDVKGGALPVEECVHPGIGHR